MATVEEVLNDMTTADVLGSAANIEYLIDNELRIITVPKNGVVLGVEGDKDVNVVHFKMPRMYRGLDLGEGFNIRVNYANAKTELGYFAVVHPDVTEDSISFEWLLGSHALMYVGEIKFAVSLIKSSVDGRIEKKFNTTLGKAQCLTGLDVDVSVPEEDIYDLLTQIKQDVMADIQPSLDGAKADAAAAKLSATQASEKADSASNSSITATQKAAEAAASAANAEDAKTAALDAQKKSEAAKDQATNASTLAQDVLKKSPYIGQNDHWFTYQNGVATDTGIVARGQRGDDGAGVVPGGTKSQVLAKKSNTDHDTEWVDPVSVPDKIMTYEDTTYGRFTKPVTVKANGTEPIDALIIRGDDPSLAVMSSITKNGIMFSASTDGTRVENTIATNCVFANNVSGTNHSVEIGRNLRKNFDGISFSGDSVIKSIDGSALDIEATNLTVKNKFSSQRAIETQTLSLKGNFVGINAPAESSFIVNGNPTFSGGISLLKPVTFGGALQKISIGSDSTGDILQVTSPNGVTVNDKKVLVEGDIPEPKPNENVLKGEAQGVIANANDIWPGPILKGKVLGQSNQVTTKGINLLPNCEAKETKDFPWGLHPTTPLTFQTPLPTGQYTVSVECGKSVNFYYKEPGNTGTSSSSYSTVSITTKDGNRMNATFTADKPIGALYFYYASEGKYSIAKAQIEAGAKATAYEPYTGGTPSPSPEYPQEITNLNKAELVITGKNLINVSKEAVSDKCATQTNGYKIENGVITFTSISKWGADYILFNEANVLGVDKLTFSMKATKAIGASNNNGAKFLCKAFDSEGNEIKVEQGLSTKEYEWSYNEYYKAYCQIVPNNTLTIALRPNIAKIRFGVCFSDTQAGTNVEIRDFQIEADSKATTYEPHQSKSTPIDLKGNELLSIPNGVRDEVVIDAEGNVSLIKRLWKLSRRIGDMNNSESYPGWQFENAELIDAIGSGIDIRPRGMSTHFQKFSINTKGVTERGGILYVTGYKQSELIAKHPDEVVTFIGERKEPQTIPLGKVELPALPESTSNVWNDGNIPANVYINYLKDVNIAYSDLENQIKQIATALSVTTLEIATK